MTLSIFQMPTLLGPKSTCCSLISNFRPRRLIIGGINTDLYGFGRGLWTSSSSIPSFIEELIVLVGMFGGQEKIDKVAQGLLYDLPTTLEKLSIVLSTGDKGWDMIEPHSIGLTPYERIWDGSEVDDLVGAVVEICAGSNGLINLIGIELLGRQSTHFASHVWSQIVKAAQDRVGIAMEARMKAGQPVLKSEEDFSGEEEWYNSLEGEWTEEGILAWCIDRRTL